MMDGDGRVAAGHGVGRRPGDAARRPPSTPRGPRADATLVELRDPVRPCPRPPLLSRVDPARDLVLVVAPAAPRDAAELTVFAIAGPGIGPGRARSATTRRDGYVTLPDVGVTRARRPRRRGARRHERHRDHLGRRAGLRPDDGVASWPTPTPSPCSATAPSGRSASSSWPSRSSPTSWRMALLVRGRRRRWGRRRGRFAGAGHRGPPGRHVPVRAGALRPPRADAATRSPSSGRRSCWRRWRCPPGAWHRAAPSLVPRRRSTGWCRSSTSSPAAASRSTPRSATRRSWPAASRASATSPSPLLVGAAMVVATGRMGRWAAARHAPARPVVGVGRRHLRRHRRGRRLARLRLRRRRRPGLRARLRLVLIWLGGWRVSVAPAWSPSAPPRWPCVAVFALVDLARPADRAHPSRALRGRHRSTARRASWCAASWRRTGTCSPPACSPLLVPALVVGFAVLVTRRRGLMAAAQARSPGLRPCLLGAVVAGVLGFAVNDSGRGDPRDDDRDGGALARPRTCSRRARPDDAASSTSWPAWCCGGLGWAGAAARPGRARLPAHATTGAPTWPPRRASSSCWRCWPSWPWPRRVAAAGWSGDVAADAGRSAVLVAAVGFGFLGLLDDLAGAASGGGLPPPPGGAARRPAHHRRREAGRRGAGGRGRRAPPFATDAAGWLLVDAAVVALAANLANLLDRAPGAPSRSGVVAFAVLAAVDGATADPRRPGGGRRGGRRPGRARPPGAGHARRHRAPTCSAPPSAWPPCWRSATPPPLVVLVVLVAAQRGERVGELLRGDRPHPAAALARPPRLERRADAIAPLYDATVRGDHARVAAEGLASLDRCDLKNVLRRSTSS